MAGCPKTHSTATTQDQTKSRDTICLSIEDAISPVDLSFSFLSPIPKKCPYLLLLPARHRHKNKQEVKPCRVQHFFSTNFNSPLNTRNATDMLLTATVMHVPYREHQIDSIEISRFAKRQLARPRTGLLSHSNRDDDKKNTEYAQQRAQFSL